MLFFACTLQTEAQATEPTVLAYMMRYLSTMYLRSQKLRNSRQSITGISFLVLRVGFQFIQMISDVFCIWLRTDFEKMGKLKTMCISRRKRVVHVH